jgi:hypothetical protein
LSDFLSIRSSSHASHTRSYSSLGIFSAQRSAIVRVPLQKWTYLRELLSHHSNPEAGHFQERAWLTLLF